MCAIYRDEAAYLREWVEFHRVVGVERFYLYDNHSVDDHRHALAPYIADGTVVLHDWPLFPGYCFARFDPDVPLPVLKCPGVVTIVSTDGRPAPIPSAQPAIQGGGSGGMP